MKLQKNHQEELLKGMEEMLLPAFVKVKEKCKGQKLLDEGVTHSGTGLPISPNLTYTTNRMVNGEQINHRKAMEKIIKHSKTFDSMNDELAKYLVKYGRRTDRMTLDK